MDYRRYGSYGKFRATSITIIKFLMIFTFVLTVLLYLAQGMSLVLNTAIVNRNSEVAFTDFSLEEVFRIEKNDDIMLYSGETVDGDSIVEYVKVKEGFGTWYDRENNALVVEVVKTDFNNVIWFFEVGEILAIALVITGVFTTKKGLLLYIIYSLSALLLIGLKSTVLYSCNAVLKGWYGNSWLLLTNIGYICIGFIIAIVKARKVKKNEKC